MQPALLQHLRTRGPAIHVRWETLLRVEPVTGPLANPDALARLIPNSVARICAALAVSPSAPLSLRAERADRLPTCDCGNNPYLAYFIAGEQAFVEAAVLLQAELPHLNPTESDIAEVVRAVRQLAREEIDTFCGVCTHYRAAPRCRHTGTHPCRKTAAAPSDARATPV